MRKLMSTSPAGCVEGDLGPMGKCLKIRRISIQSVQREEEPPPGDEEGAAEVTHSGGSVSARRTLRILEQEQQRTPLSYELFLRTHKVRTKDGLQWVNQKAISDEYKRLIAELPVDAPDEEINDAYFQSVKNIESQTPRKKKPSKNVPSPNGKREARSSSGDH